MFHIHWTLAYNLIFMKFELYISGRVGAGCGLNAYLRNHLSGLSQPTWMIQKVIIIIAVIH
jgi:hypothetical protein